MKPGLLPLIVGSSVLVGACYVRIPISHAIAEPLQDHEVRALAEQGERATTAGDWYRVRLTLPRNAVRKIARWQLYTHIRVEDCRTGELVGIGSSVGIEGTDGDFRRIREQLEADRRRQSFTMVEPIFFPASRSRNLLCVRLEGGSYTLQKISGDRVPLELRGRDA